ncbi:unnamed protein product [Paramecium sonneborni]|uniref:Uncharacterized protein n=1 Tax=Paramecium sonneborni TaxID=65129 RepID=A0A8S1LIB8_9CILI|nr:unnamed protein product [Paramecium sonneborni]
MTGFRQNSYGVDCTFKQFEEKNHELYLRYFRNCSYQNLLNLQRILNQLDRDDNLQNYLINHQLKYN